MSIAVNIYYTGEPGNARAFAEEMTRTGVVDAIRANPGNLKYAYYLPLEDDSTVLLIDVWTDQQALDAHHASPMMQEIARLREKYGLRMRVERYMPDAAGIPEADRQYLVRRATEAASPFLHE